MLNTKQYIAIDLKSFYASVECVERGLDPLDANLVVADDTRTDKTICLAVSPSLKAKGVPGRGRLFEAKQKLREINKERLSVCDGSFTGKSYLASELLKNPSFEADMIVAVPRMAHYMHYSRRIVEIYLRYVSIDDILIYSVDEVFIDATGYLAAAKMTAREFAGMLIKNVLAETGITATVGIGTNMYLAKVAMDIVAKRMPADKDGVRIAELDEAAYREQLWSHKPMTDFWRIGEGTVRRLSENGMFTMGDVARCSLGAECDKHNEELLYKLFGINAELLIDHAWGVEPAEIADCKSYTPQTKSLTEGQILTRPYAFCEGRVVVCEMADNLSMQLVKKELFTDQIVLDVCYDHTNLTDKSVSYKGETKTDRYGRTAPKSVHASENLGRFSAASGCLREAVCRAYDRITDRGLMVRRFHVSVMHLLTREQIEAEEAAQWHDDLFAYAEAMGKSAVTDDEKELRLQTAMLGIRRRYGKNFIVRGMNLLDGATAMERNRLIGGHRA